jgi:hypothetical protein
MNETSPDFKSRAEKKTWRAGFPVCRLKSNAAGVKERAYQTRWQPGSLAD